MSSVSKPQGDGYYEAGISGGAPHPKAMQVPKEYTILLGQRPNSMPKLNWAEADAMERKGFRFSVFNHGSGEYALSLPFTELVNFEKGTLTFRQD